MAEKKYEMISKEHFTKLGNEVAEAMFSLEQANRDMRWADVMAKATLLRVVFKELADNMSDIVKLAAIASEMTARSTTENNPNVYTGPFTNQKDVN